MIPVNPYISLICGRKKDLEFLRMYEAQLGGMGRV